MGIKLATTILLVGFWLVLSGHYTAFLITIGVVSCIAVVAFLSALGVINREAQPFHMLPRAPVYWLWLAKEILLSGWSVAKIILHPKLPVSLAMRRVKASQATPLGQTTYANCITLTPGTLAVELEDGEILVHAVQADSLDDLDAGEMDRRVTALEGAS